MFGKKVIDKQSGGTRYLSNPKKVNSEHDYLRKKEYFNEYTMKRGWSIPVQVYLQVKDRKCWSEGLTSKQLQGKVKASINGYRSRNQLKTKKISLGSIYSAVSNLNIYCDHIYIRNDFSNRKVCLKCNDNYHYELYEEKCLKCQTDLEVVKEYRYFCPYEGEDLEKEKRKLIAHMLRTGFKKQGLEVFEEQEIKEIEQIKQMKKEVVQNV